MGHKLRQTGGGELHIGPRVRYTLQAGRAQAGWGVTEREGVMEREKGQGAKLSPHHLREDEH